MFPAGGVKEKMLYVAGVGASAGGLEALQRFFSAMPPSGQCAYVVIQHLSPDYKSHMVELLSRTTEMPVVEAEDGMVVEPDKIYLLPRVKNMTIYRGQLYLMDMVRDNRGINLPIDIFFESLAKDMGERAIGIVLSGTGSDGTRGVRAIKEAGGIVMAQDESAKFDGMPRSAIDTQLVDLIAAPEEMSSSLMRYMQQDGRVSDPALSAVLNTRSDQMGKLLAILRDASGVDFSDYKPNTLVRRIERRMHLNKIPSLQEYVEFVQLRPAEAKVLFKEFLIGVTRFFRDREAFDIVRDRIIPNLFEGLERKDQIRVWVPGCATGEEAYTLAILFQEYMEQAGHYADVKIFATDIDRDALEFASKGAYPDSVLADLPAPELHDFFVKKGTTYEVLHQIRRKVVFAHHNVIRDPPFSKMDLITCRNLLIYLNAELQNRVLSTFEFSLRQSGYLMLGPSESVSEHLGVFAIENSKWKIYRYLGQKQPALEHLRLADRDRRNRPAETVQSVRAPRSESDWRSGDTVLESLVAQVLPPCIVVDENRQMAHAFGDLEQYLTVPTGYRVSLDVIKMIRDDLALPLSTALHRTFHEGKDVRYQRIRLKDGKLVDLTTKIFWQRSTRQRLALVQFNEATTLVEGSEPAGEVFDVSENVRQRIQDLEQQLEFNEENLQATIEELETSNEELQATNEELLAANEELQSTNEELQSVNQELMTVNSEYQAKIKQLMALNDDMDNLLSSTEVAVVFLDANLHVRKFTPAVQGAINLLRQDEGRPISHITHELRDCDLAEVARQAMQAGEPVSQDVRDHGGNWFALRALPYINHNHEPDGVVLTLFDITAHRAVEHALQSSQVQLRLMARHLPDSAVFMVDRHLRYLVADGELLTQLGLASEDFEGRRITEVAFPVGDDAGVLETWFERAIEGETFRSTHTDADGVDYTLEFRPIASDQAREAMAMAIVRVSMQQ